MDKNISFLNRTKKRIIKLFSFPFEKEKGFLPLILGVVGVLFISAGVIGGLGAKFVELKVGQIMGALLAVFTFPIMEISATFFGLSIIMLNVVTSPNFISLSYTRLDNPIISTGWTITRDLANVGIVMTLVIIGIATILKIENYQFKKTLPTLVGVALLINFSPVILGVVVDFANILMKPFLKDVVNLGRLADFQGEYWISLKDALWAMVQTQIGFEPIGKIFMLIAFQIIGGVVIYLFAFLFLFRYIAIWICVVTAPLAFFLYILPATKGLFEQWWKQFIAWCFVGLSGAFFLRLSISVMDSKFQEAIGTTTGGSTGTLGPNVNSQTSEIAGIFDSILPYGIVIAFMAFGLIVTLATSAMGASMVISNVKKGSKWVGGRTWQAMESKKFIPFPGKDKEGNRKWWYRPREAVGGITKTWEKAWGLKYFTPQVMRDYMAQRPAVEAYVKEINDDSTLEGVRFWKKSYNPEKEAAVVQNLVQTRGDSNDLIKAGIEVFGKEIVEKREELIEKFKKENQDATKEELELYRDSLTNSAVLFQVDKVKNDKDYKNYFEILDNSGLLSKIFRRDPRFAKGFGTEKQFKEAIVNATSTDGGGWEREVMDDLDVLIEVLASKDKAFLTTLGARKGGVHGRMERVDEVFKRFVDNNKEITNKNDDENNRKLFFEHLARLGGTDESGFEKALGSEQFKTNGWSAPMYNRPKGKITPAQAVGDPGVEVTVSGPGLPPEGREMNAKPAEDKKSSSKRKGVIREEDDEEIHTDFGTPNQ